MHAYCMVVHVHIDQCQFVSMNYIMFNCAVTVNACRHAGLIDMAAH